MPRTFSKKTRTNGKMQPKPLILLVAEGRNVTESQYFRSFQKQYASYNIKILIPGTITDPTGMLETIERYWEKYELDSERGDIGFVVLDLDCDDAKAKLINELARQSNKVRFIVSNPCFEVWFMLHFKFSTHSYASSAATVKDLRTIVPKYQKNIDIAPLIANRLEDAMKNAAMLKKYYESLGATWPTNNCNPMTDVPIIIDAINERDI